MLLSAPDAANDRVRVASGETVVIDVLANDTDPDGDLDPGTLTITNGDVRGNASVTDGEILYTAARRGSGDDRVDYEVCDTSGLCASASVTIRRR